jgi:hypothetical protein
MWKISIIIAALMAITAQIMWVPVTANAQGATNMTALSNTTGLSLNVDEGSGMGLVLPGETIHMFVCPRGITNPAQCQYFIGQPAQMGP